ncbi:hypothetical protein ACFXTH_013026 [Malus domestica]
MRIPHPSHHPSSRPQPQRKTTLTRPDPTRNARPRHVDGRRAGEEGAWREAMVVFGLQRVSPGCRGRQARYHAADRSTRSGPSDPGSVSFVPVYGAGSRASYRDQLGAHQGHHHRP